jgi:hypothetical protein
MTPATIQTLFNGVGASLPRRKPVIKILSYGIGDVHVDIYRSVP